MATYGPSIRRGLPRVAGGAPWPAAGDAPVSAGEVVAETVAVEAPVAEVPVAEVPVADVSVAEVPVAAPAAPQSTVASTAGVSLRRGLPRTPGGDPWPPAGAAPAASVATPAASEASAAVAVTPAEPAQPAQAAEPAQPIAAAPAAVQSVSGEAITLRRGLPRVAGGDGWPPAGAVAHRTTAPVATEGPVATEAPAATAAEVPIPASATAPQATTAPQPVTDVVAAKYDLSRPLPFKQTVFPGAYANVPVTKREPRRYGKFTFWQWAGIIVLGGGGLLVAAAMAVISVRLLLSLPFMQDFLVTYPGEYDLPDGSQPGFPAWAQWQHFFNMFLMLLIIRSGWRVRTDRRPSAFWTPKRSVNGRGKISLTLWLHQALDLLWVINGAVFIVLLFASGHWVRIVPTSWEVFPNALSAILQYVSLDWPTEHGWVNYNSIQQLMYFTVVFIAAPVAIITGLRMSHLWPKKAEKLNKLYPVEVARALHLPTMLFFVAFIIIHVFLVFATGALRNLNHMFGGTDEVNWTGFWLFFAALCVMVGGWFAARPLVVAPIAKLFGKVSTR